MSKAKAAASIISGTFLTLLGGLGFVALVIATVLEVYAASLALWIALPLIFVVGVALVMYGLVVLIQEVSEMAGDSMNGVSDLTNLGNVKELHRLYRRMS